VPDNRKFIRK